MLSAYVLIETEVGKVAHVAQALTKLDGVQLAEDLVGVGPKQQPVLEGGGLPLGGVAHRIAGAGTDRPDRPPLGTGGEAGPAAAAEPASGYLLDDRNGPGGQGGLEPASSSGGLVFTEGPWTRSRRGTSGSLRFPKPVPARLERQSSLLRPADWARSWATHLTRSGCSSAIT